MFKKETKLGSNPQNPKTVKKLKVLYVRVSSLEQKTDRQRIHEDEYDLILEDKISGSIDFFKRPKGDELKRLINKGVIQSISVWSINRFGRNLLNLLETLKYFEEKKIQVNFISQGLKTTDGKGNQNPMAKMLISILGTVSEMERMRIREAQAEGIKIAKAQNRYKGRQQNSKESLHTFLNKPRNLKAAQYLKKGYKGTEICKLLEMSPTTVSKIKRLNDKKLVN